MVALNATWLDDVDEWAQRHLKDKLVNAGKPHLQTINSQWDIS